MTAISEPVARHVAEFINGKYNYYTDMIPSRGGNIAFTCINGFYLLFQTCIGIYTRQWWFLVSFFCGCALEFLGFIGRSLSSGDPTNGGYYRIQIVGLTIAPSFFAAGMYYTFGKLIVIYGQQYSSLDASVFSWLFIVFDLVSIVIQGIGGGMASAESSQNISVDPGTYTMVAGLAAQALSMTVFIGLWSIFLWKINKARRLREQQQFSTNETDDPLFNPEFEDLRRSRYFQIFLYAYSAAIIFIYIRCIYRVIELAEGWTSYLTTHEIYFMILDGMMISIALLLMCCFHPGLVFGRNRHIPVLKRARRKQKLRREQDSEARSVPLEQISYDESRDEDTESSRNNKASVQ